MSQIFLNPAGGDLFHCLSFLFFLAENCCIACPFVVTEDAVSGANGTHLEEAEEGSSTCLGLVK